jgi:hypothetical protein
MKRSERHPITILSAFATQTSSLKKPHLLVLLAEIERLFLPQRKVEFALTATELPEHIECIMPRVTHVSPAKDGVTVATVDVADGVEASEQEPVLFLAERHVAPARCRERKKHGVQPQTCQRLSAEHQWSGHFVKEIGSAAAALKALRIGVKA